MTVVLNNEGEREFLRVVEEEGGRAVIGDIIRLSSLNRSQVQRRFKTLRRKDLIEIERDKSETAKGVPAAKVAVLTPLAEKEIQEGLTVEARDTYEEKKSVEELRRENSRQAERIDELKAEIERFKRQVNSGVVARQLVLEERMSAVLSALYNVNMDVEISEEVLETIRNDAEQKFENERNSELG